MPFFEKKYLPELVLFILAVALYANTFRHGFVLDDQIVLTQNSFVKQGIAGLPDIFGQHSFAGYTRLADQQKSLSGGRYRPLSLALFAVLHGVFGENQMVFHGLAILLYALTGVLLYRLFLSLLNGIAGTDPAAWLAAMLFVAHPVHTEVVANVKSCDEQLALLLGMGAWLAVLHAFDNSKRHAWFLAAPLFFLACLAKENAVLLAFTIPVSLWFFRKTSIVVALRQAIPLFVAMAVFLFLRTMVTAASVGVAVADPLNNPFLIWNGNAWLSCSGAEKAATVVYTLGLQLRLLVFPYPLTHDYFHLSIQSFAKPGPWVGLVVLALLVAYILIGFRQRQLQAQASPTLFQVASFGLMFLLFTISLTSNILFPVGAFMAERFLYLPSLGFCLAAVAWGKLFFDKYAPKLPLPFFIAVTLVFAMLTIGRNPAWKDNLALHQAAISAYAGSPKLNNDLGALLLEKATNTADSKERQALLELAYPMLQKALEAHPTYFDAYLAHGACAYYLGKLDSAVASYEMANKLSPQDPKSSLGLRYALEAYADDLAKRQQFPEAIATMTKAWQLKPDTLSAAHLSRYYHSQHNSEKSVEWLEKALELAPGDQRLEDALKDERQ